MMRDRTMDINDPEINNFIQLVNFKKSNLELLEQVSNLATAIEKLQLALKNLQFQIEEQQLKQLQEEFQEVVKARNLEAEFKETLARLDLDQLK